MGQAAVGEDFLQRFLFEALDIRGALLRLGPAWRAMQDGRGYPAVVRDVLGQLTAVTLLIGGNLKQPGRLIAQVQGHGPIPLMVVDCDEALRLRGVAKWQGDPAGLSMAELFGDGRLALTLQAGPTPRPYQSLVPLEGNTLAQAFEHFLAQSEQLPARLQLHAGAAQATGLFLQKLPGADARDPDGWNRVLQLAQTVSAAEMAELPPQTLLTRVFPEESVRLFDARPVRFHCPRDWDKVRSMLRALGRAEVESIVREHGEVVVHDDICNHTYRLSADEAVALFADPDAGATLH